MKPYTLLLIVLSVVVFAIIVDAYRKWSGYGRDIFGDKK